MTTNVIEVITFKLNNDTDLAQFHIANNTFQNFIDKQPGVFYRSLAKQAETQQYIDVIYFATPADAKRVSDMFFENEQCQQFAALIEKQSVQLTHYEVLSQTACQQS
ncbi:hypothetical protein AMS58_11680 [Pseudoalteromonas porphyrae]|uniref:ABM domain-containing protein n=1 Tax=Pseudoalteromonas porphyrae TaxID=187330 RepID=A0A0N1EJ74_9GAMM|nr:MULTISPECIES: hypothetical protein [Pseudoalteromonas]KPH62890.1 hypothetical protein ADS77_10910 [Pseudoalteromonas porphyrae]KPH94412.1 hypothetical protein AMS58_11680 [Pseudoalteromonas porphyrae]NMR24529.1 hypothetical protein [Pseudoalteromonas sp. NEC-BIFX-2020_015]NNG42687.1 hypothetical protein [Pseudoalteromonas sp. NEC-BIFX-2020_002]